jgi:hypothetical protein
MLLDLDIGSITLYKNDHQLGVLVGPAAAESGRPASPGPGLGRSPGGWRWAVSLMRAGDAVSVEAFASPDAAELTLIDLPGIIHSVKDDAHASDIAQVKSMLTEYIKHPQTLVLVVMEAGIDTERQGALTLVKEQPEWER